MLPVPTEAEILGVLRRHVSDAAWQLELVGASSNYVFRCVSDGLVVAVRSPRVDLARPSHYWRQVQEVFGLCFPPSSSQLTAASAATRAAGMDSPRLLAEDAVGDRPIYITTWMPGQAWKPDAFPASDSAHRRLGIFLAEMHSRATDGFGSLDGDLRPPAQYFEAAVTSAEAVIDAGPWAVEKAQLVETMTRCDPDNVAASFAVVMPDICASQFLFGDADIAAVVDIDSYVRGPVELELTVAEWCLVDHRAFAEGYESVRRLPRFSDFRAFHRSTMLINEEALTGDLQRLLTENAVFP